MGSVHSLAYHTKRLEMELYRQASEVTRDVLALPPKYLGMYGDFVTKNASSVGQIEGALRSLTYIIPGTLRL